eukprot:TRINITY_DN413_c0_g1_i2.p1 TRINITY_DN413_c0_g1~~TRINITY_DN413_c0_g1_i2.p1  ORF type:complete len:216 (+),score=56.05 TRINITY_DN413_c0_g1_i2:74-721(+)
MESMIGATSGVAEKQPEKLEKPQNVVILGNGGVGKSSVLQRFTTGSFRDDLQAMAGMERGDASVAVGEKIVPVLFWDTPGVHSFQTLTASALRVGRIFLVVYSVTDRRSFDAVPDFVKKIRDVVPDARIFAVGNKTDLATDRVVTCEDGASLAAVQTLDFFAEISCKEGCGFAELEENVGQTALRVVIASRQPGSVILDAPAQPPSSGKARGWCC